MGVDERLVQAAVELIVRRLFAFGPDVAVGVPDPADPSRWLSKSLREAQPYYWKNAFQERRAE
jgi:hypothetical protein